MNGDGRDADDADWLLAQLASGRPPARQDPPVAPPPSVAASPVAETFVEPVTAPPVAQPFVTPTPAPRREEVLDWFSLAESENEPETATRALPVIGALPERVAPPAPEAPAVPMAPSAPAEPAAPAGLPAWNPPFTVGRPTAVPPVAVPPVAGPPVAVPPVAVPPVAVPPVAGPPPVSSPLTSVEPPVGAARSVPQAAAPAPQPVMPEPPAPHLPLPSAEPVTPQTPPAAPVPQAAPMPPGPVTPPAQFALTWGNGDLDSEEAIRAAFRSLSAPGSANFEPSAAPEPPPQHLVPDAAGPPPEPDASSEADPFAEFTPPPVARRSFTPVTRATPQHPIAPTTAPAGWDERAAQPTPHPPAAGFDDELWSALVEEEPAPVVPAPPADTPVPPSAAANPFVPPAAPEPPAAQFPRPDVFPPGNAFPAAATQPPVEFAAAPPATMPGPTPAPSPESAQSDGGFPFIEVRGEAGSPAAFVAATPAETANLRAPFPAFASTGSDDLPRRPDPQPHAPVDDLLAALGGGATRPTGDEGFGDAGGRGGDGFGTPPGGGGIPPEEPEEPQEPEPADGGLDAFGFGFHDDAEAAGADVDEPADAEPESPIARELAETGFFWNLTPDPAATDPKAEQPEEPTVPSPLAQPSPFAVDGAAAEEPEPQWRPEPDWQPEADWSAEPQRQAEPQPEWSFGGEELNAMFPPAATPAEPIAPAAPRLTHDDDPLASLFGASAAQQSAAAPWPPAASAAPTAPSSAPPTAVAAYRAPAPAPGGTGAGRGPAAPTGGSGGSGGNRTLRTLMWIAGAFVVAVVLAGLFYVGTRLSGGGAAEAPSASPSATGTPVAEPTGPQPVGAHAWNTLFGGECIDPFDSAWAEEFSVVDCAAPHAAQLVYRGELPDDAAAPFPGEEAIASQMNLLCSAPGIIDVSLVAGLPDLQVQAAFPVTEEQWTGGERTYYCFANRAGGEPLTGSIAGPGPSA